MNKQRGRGKVITEVGAAMRGWRRGEWQLVVELVGRGLTWAGSRLLSSPQDTWRRRPSAVI